MATQRPVGLEHGLTGASKEFMELDHWNRHSVDHDSEQIPHALWVSSSYCWNQTLGAGAASEFSHPCDAATGPFKAKLRCSGLEKRNVNTTIRQDDSMLSGFSPGMGEYLVASEDLIPRRPIIGRTR